MELLRTKQEGKDHEREIEFKCKPAFVLAYRQFVDKNHLLLLPDYDFREASYQALNRNSSVGRKILLEWNDFFCGVS